MSRIPKPGETVAGSTFATAPGGKGANQALAAARAGAKVRMIGAASRDYMGKEATALLEAGGVDMTGVKRLDMPQGVAMIMVEDSGENSIVIVPRATASRAVTAFAETSTIFTSPRGPTCESPCRDFSNLGGAFLLMGPSLRKKERQRFERHGQVHALQLDVGRYLQRAG